MNATTLATIALATLSACATSTDELDTTAEEGDAAEARYSQSPYATIVTAKQDLKSIWIAKSPAIMVTSGEQQVAAFEEVMTLTPGKPDTWEISGDAAFHYAVPKGVEITLNAQCDKAYFLLGTKSNARVGHWQIPKRMRDVGCKFTFTNTTKVDVPFMVTGYAAIPDLANRMGIAESDGTKQQRLELDKHTPTGVAKISIGMVKPQPDVASFLYKIVEGEVTEVNEFALSDCPQVIQPMVAKTGKCVVTQRVLPIR